LLIVRKERQARITADRGTIHPALSLLARPQERKAIRAATGYARSREYSGLPPGPRPRLESARVERGPTITLREGGEPFPERKGLKVLRRAKEVWSAMLSTELGSRWAGCLIREEKTSKPERIVIGGARETQAG